MSVRFDQLHEAQIRTENKHSDEGTTNIYRKRYAHDFSLLRINIGLSYPSIISNGLPKSIQFSFQLRDRLCYEWLNPRDPWFNHLLQMLHVQKKKSYRGYESTHVAWIWDEKEMRTFESIFPKYSDPILEARCLYSGVFAKYSRSLRLAAIMSTFLLISCWDRLTTPTHGCWSR